MNLLDRLRARLFRRDEHVRKERELNVLEARSHVQLARVDRLLEERSRLRDAVKNTAAALRAEGRR